MRQQGIMRSDRGARVSIAKLEYLDTLPNELCSHLIEGTARDPDSPVRASELRDASNTWLLSLHPRHWEAIAKGSKCYELRRQLPNATAAGDRVIVYVTRPVGLVCGAFTIGEVVESDTAIGLWAKVADGVPTASMQQALDYYEGARRFRAIRVVAVEMFEPYALGKHPPQGIIRA